MKIIILAAGAGKRFRALNLPKPLTRLITGQSILGLQIETLSRYVLIDQIFIVVGYHKEKVMDQFPDLTYVYNPAFSTENTSKSLLRALKKIDDDVLWMNGDVVFTPSVLEALLNTKNTSMVVNEAPVGDEEVKYRTNKHGQILEVSKQVTQPQGEAVGINFFTRHDLPALKRNLEMCAPNDYFEKAIEMCIEESIPIQSVVIDSDSCTEVDFPEDLKRANRILM
ncbi:MAG: phosphocholine cytidylyltransferase family protein [Parachlamydiaceae bacterium]|nr:phosphocholine cytidylyltransferase family protein [Parachlamydiaceae bacterium]